MLIIISLKLSNNFWKRQNFALNNPTRFGVRLNQPSNRFYGSEYLYLRLLNWKVTVIPTVVGVQSLEKKLEELEIKERIVTI